MATTVVADERADFIKRHSDEIGKLTKRYKKFHASIILYLKANGGVWPQVPEKVITDERSFADWWQKALKPHGIDAADWKWEGFDGLLAFVPSSFSDESLICFKWSSQPWLMASNRVGAV